jgi:hypothetical protein
MSDQPSAAVKFNRAQADYLIANFSLPAAAVASLRSEARSVELSAVERKKLVDQVANRLQRVGFDADYEPTEEGIMLESLIDALTA